MFDSRSDNRELGVDGFPRFTHAGRHPRCGGFGRRDRRGATMEPQLEAPAGRHQVKAMYDHVNGWGPCRDGQDTPASGSIRFWPEAGCWSTVPSSTNSRLPPPPADIVVLDIEDAVAPKGKLPPGRTSCAGWLRVTTTGCGSTDSAPVLGRRSGDVVRDVGGRGDAGDGGVGGPRHQRPRSDCPTSRSSRWSRPPADWSDHRDRVPPRARSAWRSVSVTSAATPGSARIRRRCPRAIAVHHRRQGRAPAWVRSTTDGRLQRAQTQRGNRGVRRVRNDRQDLPDPDQCPTVNEGLSPSQEEILLGAGILRRV